MKDIKDFFAPILPPKAFHWKTFLFISILIWMLSAVAEADVIFRDRLAVLSLIFLIIGICWRTSQPPFVIYGVPLSPWISGALISLLLSQKMVALPHFPLQVFPIISGCLIYIVEFFNEKLTIHPSPPLMRSHFIMVMLSHLLISCWIKFYFIIVDNSGTFKNLPLIEQALR